MIRVLQNWQEIGEAILAIEHKGLPKHQDPRKNWDHFLLYQAIASQDRSSCIFDLGCGWLDTLKFLASVGFTNIHGIDFEIRAKPESNAQYRLYQGDLTKTPLPNDSCDIVVSVSVIEHGVDLEKFFQEVSRLLKAGGLLFITTDYWEEIDYEPSVKPFGLSWKVFNKKNIQSLICLAQQNGLVLEKNIDIPPCEEITVFWQNTDYTFISLFFRKVA